MTHDTIDYAGLIREHGHRLTPQRELILEAVCEGGEHTTFDGIYQRVQVKSSSIDRSTVYRTLDFLCQMRLVVSSEIDGTQIYEIAAGQPPHHHLICRSCGASIRIDHDLFGTLYEAIERTHHFVADTNHLILYGLCEQCRDDQA